MLIRILIFTIMRIQIPVRILLLITVMWICNHCTGLLTLQGSILSLHASNVSIHGPPWLHWEPLKILNFEFNSVPDLAFHCNVDPACHNNADPCGSGSATLEKYTLFCCAWKWLHPPLLQLAKEPSYLSPSISFLCMTDKDFALGWVTQRLALFRRSRYEPGIEFFWHLCDMFLVLFEPFRTCFASKIAKYAKMILKNFPPRLLEGFF